MPPVSKPSLILVTGASGFIGSWTCKTLLDVGFSVRAAVRTEEKANFLKNLFSSFGSKFETALVPVITVDGAYDNAIKDVEGVVHMAGPAHFMFEDPKDVTDVHYNGTLNILSSSAKTPTVKRIIYMSSGQALVGKGITYIYSEVDWNDGAVKNVKESGKAASGEDKYAAGKVLAERAVLNYPKEHNVSFDSLSILPPFTFGPIIHDVKTFSDLNFTNQYFWGFIANPKTTAEDLNGYGSDYVDVRDVADIVVLAFGSPTKTVAGERFCLDAGVFTPQNLYDTLNSDPPVPHVPKGDPGITRFHFPGTFVNASKAVATFNFKFRSLETMAKDTALSLQAKAFDKTNK